MLPTRRFCLLHGLALAVVLALSPAAHAASSSVERCERSAARAHQVLPADKLANWEPLDDRAVLIWTGRSTRAYLVLLSRPLRGLTRAPIITLIDPDRDRTISPCGRDALALGEAKHVAATPIASIRLLSEQSTLQLEQAMHHPSAERPAPAIVAI